MRAQRPERESSEMYNALLWFAGDVCRMGLSNTIIAQHVPSADFKRAAVDEAEGCDSETKHEICRVFFQGRILLKLARA